MDVIDRLRYFTELLQKQGVEIRFEDLNGMPSGMCSVRDKPILLIEITLPSTEQLEILKTEANRLADRDRSVA